MGAPSVAAGAGFCSFCISSRQHEASTAWALQLVTFVAARSMRWPLFEVRPSDSPLGRMDPMISPRRRCALPRMPRDSGAHAHQKIPQRGRAWRCCYAVVRPSKPIVLQGQRCARCPSMPCGGLRRPAAPPHRPTPNPPDPSPGRATGGAQRERGEKSRPFEP